MKNAVAIVVILTCCYLFKPVKTMFEFGKGRISYFSCFLLLAATTPLLGSLITGSVWRNSVIFDEVVFAASLTLWTLLLHLLCLYKKGNQKRIAMQISLLQTVLISLFSGMFLIYYVSSGALIGVNSITAIYQTHYLEAVDFLRNLLSIGYGFVFFVITVLLLGVFFSFNRQVKFKGIESSNRKLGIVLISAFLLMSVAVVFAFPRSYSGRTLTSSNNYFVELENFKKMRSDRKAFTKHVSSNTISTDSQGGTYILVIGESHNKLHMSAYGYSRPTTPTLDGLIADNQILLFKNAYSAHTHTIQALSLALTEASQYNSKKYEQAVSLLEVAKAAGFKVTWISNQVRYGAWDLPVSVMADQADEQIWINQNVGATAKTEFFDGKLVEAMKTVDTGSNNLIIIHLMGSHSFYKDRFPRNLNVFTDASLLEVDVDKKGLDDINSYDNSVLYNDYVVSEILKTGRELFNVNALLYFSDHSEAVTKGLYHNADQFDFDMTRIPLYMYFSDDYIARHSHIVETLRDHQAAFFSNDMVYDTMLGMMRIKTDFYDAKQDLSSREYNFTKDNLLTLYGERKVSDDPLLQ